MGRRVGLRLTAPGRQLFQRRKGATSTLTDDGREALELVEQILETSAHLLRHSPKPVTKTVVRISIGPYLCDAYLKPLVPRFCREFPDAEIDILPMVSEADAHRLVAEGTLDLAVFNPVSQTPVTHGEPICEFPLVMVGPPGTRALLAAGDCALEDFQFIFPLRREYGARWSLNRLRELGIQPRVAPLFVEFPDMLAQMVADGQGIGYLTARSVAGQIADGRLEVLDIAIEPMRRIILRSPQASQAALRVRQWLHQSVGLSEAS